VLVEGERRKVAAAYVIDPLRSVAKCLRDKDSGDWRILCLVVYFVLCYCVFIRVAILQILVRISTQIGCLKPLRNYLNSVRGGGRSGGEGELTNSLISADLTWSRGILSGSEDYVCIRSETVAPPRDCSSYRLLAGFFHCIFCNA